MRCVRIVDELCAPMNAAPLACLGALILAATSLDAQERESAFASAFDRVGRAILTTFQRPLRPVVETSLPGAGIGAGVAFVAPTGGPWFFGGGSTLSTRAFTELRASGGYTSSRVAVALYGRASDAPRLEYFGQGPSSEESDRSSYRLREDVLGIASAVRFSRWLAVGARLEKLHAEVRRGKSPSLPATEDLFGEPQVPGLTRQPRLTRYATDVYLDVPAAGYRAVYQGGQVHIGLSAFSDRDINEYSFSRVDVSVFQALAVSGPLRRLLLHALVSRASPMSGDAVPFYMQNTLGGQRTALAPFGNVDAVEPAVTLRAYPNFRFGDRSLVFMQAEYRHAIWGPIEAAAFADAGQVAARVRDFSMSDVSGDMGVGIVLLRGPATAARVDVAVGAEGARLLLRIGGIQVP